MKKVSDKNLFYIVFLLCLVGAILFFVLGYSKLNDSCAAIKADNNTIKNHIAELQKYYDEKDTYQQETELLFKEVANLLNKFPSDIRSEDMIVQGIDVYNTANASGLNMIFSSIALGDKQKTFEVTQGQIDAVQSEDYTQPIIFNLSEAAYTNETNYKSLRDGLGAIFASKYPVSVEKIAYNMDEETGILSGVIQVGFYSVSGTNKEYVAPEFKKYEMGTDNVFVNTAFVVPETEE